MTGYKPYPRYQPIKAGWLGGIPEHWKVVPLKAIASVELSNVDKKSVDDEPEVRLCNYVDVYKNERITQELSFMQATASVQQIKRLSLQQDDVLLTKDSESPDDIGVPSLVAEPVNAVCGYHLALARPNLELCNGGFLTWFMRSTPNKAYFETEAKGLTRYGIDKSSIKDMPVAYPPLEDQKNVRSFLDRETARIDSLIAKKTRFIELLKEKRQALITKAVTKGLDDSVPMKESGVKWLGMVPAHWAVSPLRYIARVQTGIAKGKEYSNRTTRQVPYLRVANVQDGYLDLDDVAMIDMAPDDIPRYSLKNGDVLMNEGGDFDKLGRGHIWKGELDTCVHQNHVFAVRPTGVSSEWLSAYTSSKPAQFYFMWRSKQTTNLASISSSNLMSLLIPVPPKNDQASIIEALNKEHTRINRLVSLTESSIELLKEHRAALITAAVTGKIDVRGETA